MSLEVGGSTDVGGGDVGNSAVDSNKDVVVKEDAIEEAETVTASGPGQVADPEP